MRERKRWRDKGADGNKDNTTYFHAMLKNLNFTLLYQGKNKKRRYTDVASLTDNTGKKLVRRERTEDQYVWVKLLMQKYDKRLAGSNRAFQVVSFAF